MDKIIYIAGVARSGTSWLGQILDSSPIVKYRFQPLFSYEFKNWVNEDSTKKDFNDFFNKLYATETEFLTQKNKRASGEYPLFKKKTEPNYLVFKENRYQSIIEPMLRKINNLYLVGIIRNPCAVLNSWMKNEKEFPKGSDPLKEWRFGNCKNNGIEDYFGYYKWKEVANLYLDLKDKYPDRVYVISYENIVENPLAKTEEIFKFIGLHLDKQTVDFIKDSTNNYNAGYYSVYKHSSVKDKWKKELNDYIRSEVESDIKNTRLEQFYK